MRFAALHDSFRAVQTHHPHGREEEHRGVFEFSNGSRNLFDSENSSTISAMDESAQRDGWAFETKSSEFLVDLRGGNVWRDEELINCAGLTHDRHFKGTAAAVGEVASDGSIRGALGRDVATPRRSTTSLTRCEGGSGRA